MIFDPLSPAGHLALARHLAVPAAVESYLWGLWLRAELEVIGYALIAAFAVPAVMGLYRTTRATIHALGRWFFGEDW